MKKSQKMVELEEEIDLYQEEVAKTGARLPRLEGLTFTTEVGQARLKTARDYVAINQRKVDDLRGQLEIETINHVLSDAWTPDDTTDSAHEDARPAELHPMVDAVENATHDATLNRVVGVDPPETPEPDITHEHDAIETIANRADDDPSRFVTGDRKTDATDVKTPVEPLTSTIGLADAVLAGIIAVG